MRVLLRFVAEVDRAAVEDTWVKAHRLSGDPREICLFVMGRAVAPVADLGKAIDHLRARSGRAGTFNVVPVDIRTWSAHVSTDASSVVRALVQRLQAA